MALSDFPIGTKVSFLPGPRSTTKVTGKVTGQDGQFLVVAGDDKTRKIRPGAVTATN